MAEPAVVDRQNPAQLHDWAFEHLAYEVNTLTYVVSRLAEKPTGSEVNALVESFAVHTRCLHDFFWRDRTSKNFDADAFAADFCVPGHWEKVRGDLPPHLAATIKRKRFGAEVMHLTYKRISGVTEQKLWPCGDIYVELADVLAKFAETALPDRLPDSTRNRFKDLVTTGKDGIRSLSQATGMVPVHPISGGTINLSEVRT
jgi:hypothetical protein